MYQLHGTCGIFGVMRKSISKSAFIGALAAFVVVLLSSGKLPSESPDKIAPPSKAQWVEAKMNALSLDEKIAQFFMVAGYSNRGEEHLLELDSLVSKHKVGGIIFFQ